MLVDDDQSSNAALLEFRAVESVASALAKDRRKLDGQEISVTMLWRSTLFVTNFPRELDDDAVRKLFSNVRGLGGT
jgi:RNA recognition motif-containing protein